MHPYLCRYGGFVVSSYAFLYGLGVAVAGLVLALLLRKKGYGLRRSANLFILAAVAVVVGGRILYGIVRWSAAKADLQGFLTCLLGAKSSMDLCSSPSRLYYCLLNCLACA